MSSRYTSDHATEPSEYTAAATPNCLDALTVHEPRLGTVELHPQLRLRVVDGWPHGEHRPGVSGWLPHILAQAQLGRCQRPGPTHHGTPAPLTVISSGLVSGACKPSCSRS
jgi:hypothetical protein